MFGLFGRKKELPLLRVCANGTEIAAVAARDVPTELTPVVQMPANSYVEFKDSTGGARRHDLGDYAGWFHFSVRVQPNLACQVDCVITDSRELQDEEVRAGRARGVRFQPFFLPSATVGEEVFVGRGLFRRGLHYGGQVTQGWISLSCVCDRCRRSFLIRSFHSGFSGMAYFYSGSGQYTLTVSEHAPGAPVALSSPDREALARLEGDLPLAPDGSAFGYWNPFRCPHCHAAYIDFETHPEERPAEYYGNYFPGIDLVRYEPALS